MSKFHFFKNVIYSKSMIQFEYGCGLKVRSISITWNRFQLKSCWWIQTLHLRGDSRDNFVLIQMCASFNHCKVKKIEPSWLIPRKLRANWELSMVYSKSMRISYAEAQNLFWVNALKNIDTGLNIAGATIRS